MQFVNIDGLVIMGFSLFLVEPCRIMPSVTGNIIILGRISGDNFIVKCIGIAFENIFAFWRRNAELIKGKLL